MDLPQSAWGLWTSPRLKAPLDAYFQFTRRHRSCVWAWEIITSMNSFHPFIQNHGKVAENSSSNLINKLESSKKECLISSWKCQEDNLLQETPLQQLCLWKARNKRLSYNKYYMTIISILHRLFSILLSYYWILGNNFPALVFNEEFLQRRYFFFPSFFISSLI